MAMLKDAQKEAERIKVRRRPGFGKSLQFPATRKIWNGKRHTSETTGNNPYRLLLQTFLREPSCNNITSFSGSSCANNRKGALNTPEYSSHTITSICGSSCAYHGKDALNIPEPVLFLYVTIGQTGMPNSSD
eukprot:6266775-Pyramimonas_sp.AAC.1